MSVLKDPLITLVVAMHDDEAIIEPFIEAAHRQLAEVSPELEIILVDDDSADGTVERANRLLARYGGLRLIVLARSYGFDVAASAGLDASLGDCVIVMNPKCDPVEAIPLVVRKSLDEDRILQGRMTDFERRFAPRMLRRVLRPIVGRGAASDLFEAYTTFYALPRRAVVAITREKFRIRSLPSMTRSIGFPRATFDYERATWPRGGGQGSGSLSRLITYLISGNILPLRLATYAGLLACGLNLLYGVYIGMANLIRGRVAEGWTTLSFQVNGLFFLVFIILVIQSEYLGVILQESREAPPYHVRDESKSLVLWMQADRRNVVNHSSVAPGDPADET